LESLLIDACSFVDSLSQTFVREKAGSGYAFKEQARITDLSSKVSGHCNFNFGDYRTLLETDFGFSNKKVNVNAYEDALYPNPLQYGPDQVNGYIICPFAEWASVGKSTPWWKAFTNLKHDRLHNFHDATLGNCIHAMAAAFILLTLRNESEFKSGMVPAGLYDLFLPKYWIFGGRVMPGVFMWQLQP
jgi:hypothetical protein